MRSKEARCGRKTGYDRHIRNGEQPCDRCAEARREYDQRRRQSDEERIAQRIRAAAMTQARARLAREFPDLHARYYEEIKARLWAEEMATREDDRD